MLGERLSLGCSDFNRNYYVRVPTLLYVLEFLAQKGHFAIQGGDHPTRVMYSVRRQPRDQHASNIRGRGLPALLNWRSMGQRSKVGIEGSIGSSLGKGICVGLSFSNRQSLPPVVSEKPLVLPWLPRRGSPARRRLTQTRRAGPTEAVVLEPEPRA
ncbi:hypothetical protein BHM03_00002300 [Ensete ventricosum]|nr:hypothetical protein BHM03_00002300 [Ensete ventricosum]